MLGCFESFWIDAAAVFGSAAMLAFAATLRKNARLDTDGLLGIK
jgi:hypothetical protein